MWRANLRWLFRIAATAAIIGAVAALLRFHQMQQPEYLASQAHKAIAAGDDARAEVFLRNLLRKAPGDADARITLADLYVRNAQQQGRPASYAADARAMQQLYAAAASRPDDLELHAKLMTAQLEGGQAAAAALTARSMVRAGSDNQTALYLATADAIAAGNFRSAEAPLARLVQLQREPRFRTLLLQAQYSQKTGEKERLAEWLARASRKAADMSPKALSDLEQDDRRALLMLLALGVELAEDPAEGHARAKVALSVLQRSSGLPADDKGKVSRVNEAGIILARMEAVEPLKASADVALLAARRQLLSQFAEFARPVVIEKDAQPVVFRLLAEVELAEGRVEPALALVQQGLSHGEGSPPSQAAEISRLHLVAAQCLLAQHRFSEATPHLQWLLKDEATAPAAHRLAGDVALDEGRLEDAVRHFSAALPRLGNSVHVQSGLASALLRLGRWEEAVPHLNAVLARLDNLRPEELASVQQHLGNPEYVPLHLATAYLALKQYDKLLPIADALTACDREPAAVQVMVAYHFGRGEREQAAERLREGRSKYPDDFGLLLCDVNMCRSASNAAEADALLQRFVAGHPTNSNAQVAWAQWQVARGQFKAALEVATELIKRLPDEAGPKVLRADILLAAGKLDEALPAIEELRTLGVPHSAIALLQARAALMGHQLDQAAAALGLASEDFQRNGLVRMWKGEVAMAQGDASRAVSEYAESFPVTALRPLVRAKLVQALGTLLQRNDFAAADAQVKELLTKFPDEPSLLVVASELALQQTRFEEGLRLLDRAEALQPNSSPLIYAKARMWFLQGNTARALSEVERSLRVDPRHQPSQLLAAELHLARKEPSAALAYVEQVLAANPDLPDARLLQAQILCASGDSKKAADLLESLLVGQPGVLRAYALLAEIYEEQPDADKALDVLRRGQQQAANDPLLCRQEIRLLCRLGRRAEAEEAARRLAGEHATPDTCLALGATFLAGDALDAAQRWAQQAMTSANPSQQTATRLLLANVNLVRGRREANKEFLGLARSQYGEVLQAQPENLLAANNLAWLLATQFDQLDAARDVVNRALGKTSSKRLPATVAETFAMVYRKSGQLQRAQELVEEALARSPDAADLHLQAGLIYGQRERPDAARHALEKAVALGLSQERMAEAEQELQRLATPSEEVNISPKQQGKGGPASP